MTPDEGSTHGKGEILSPRYKEHAIKATWFVCAFFAVVTIVCILAFLTYDAFPVFLETGVVPFLFGPVWDPTGSPPEYGIYPLIAGTLLVTLGAMLLAVPLGIAGAIYLAELAPVRVRQLVKPAIELLAGIPSVVLGFFGLLVLTDWLRVTFNVPTGECWLAGSILLGIMALPIIVSVSEDAISSVPREYKEGSLAVGATHWQTISRVTLPAALSGISAAVILGMGRAIGETMAVLMVTGNAAIVPSPIWNVLSPVRTLTGTIGIEMGEVSTGSLHYHALFGVAIVLLLITLAVNVLATRAISRIRQRYMGRTANQKKGSWVPFPTAFTSTKETLKRAVPALLISSIALFFLVASGLPVAVAIAGLCVLVTVLMQRLSPRQVQVVMKALVMTAVIVVLGILAIILFDIVSKGLPAISWEFLTQPPADLGRSGGIYPAIVGTLYLVAGAILIALPLGIGAAIYLTEYTLEGRMTRCIRTGADLLNGTPSIVFGLFGFAFLVLYLNFGVSLLAGQVTLALMVLPTIIRTTEESLKTVPNGLREGSFALGATRWQTISRVVLPPAVPGIITGTILSIGRAAGETAPILFTAVVFSQRFLPSSVFDPVMALPYHLYILATNVPGADQQKYGTALVLLVLVIGLYTLAIFVRNHFQKHYRW